MRKSNIYRYWLHRQIVLGTSIVPIGKARVEQMAKAQDAYDKYIEAKKTNPNARKQVVEMRVDFIPFVYGGVEYDKKSPLSKRQQIQAQFNAAMKLHDMKVLKRIDELNREAHKRWKVPADIKVFAYEGIISIQKKFTGSEHPSMVPRSMRIE